MHRKLYVGCGPKPYHPQHLDIIGDISEWTLIDKYVHEEGVENWDGRHLKEVADGTIAEIYSSHTLEHFEHTMIRGILTTWYDKLEPGGKLTINVPDLIWALNRVKHLENEGSVEGAFNGFDGERGLLVILFGAESHEGEYHKCAFTKSFLTDILIGAGFGNILVDQTVDAHDMGVLFATAEKPQERG